MFLIKKQYFLGLLFPLIIGSYKKPIHEIDYGVVYARNPASPSGPWGFGPSDLRKQALKNKEGDFFWIH